MMRIHDKIDYITLLGSVQGDQHNTNRIINQRMLRCKSEHFYCHVI